MCERADCLNFIVVIVETVTILIDEDRFCHRW